MEYTIETEWSKKGLALFLRQKNIISSMKYEFDNSKHIKYFKNYIRYWISLLFLKNKNITVGNNSLHGPQRGSMIIKEPKKYLSRLNFKENPLGYKKAWKEAF